MDVALIQLPQVRVQDIVQFARLFIPSVSLTAGTFLRLLGLIAACLRAVPKLYMRRIQLYFLSRWNHVSKPLSYRIVFPPTLAPQIAFWRNSERLSRGVSFQNRPVQEVVTTDAPSSRSCYYRRLQYRVGRSHTALKGSGSLVKSPIEVARKLSRVDGSVSDSERSFFT